MTEIVWGPEIAVNGKRPDWLADGAQTLMHRDMPSGRWYGRTGTWTVRELEIVDWNTTSAIRLPVDHPYYTTPTAPNTPAGYSDEVVERCVALVRKCHDLTDYDHPVPGAPFIGKATTEDELWLAKEARAIVALLPEPVDADLLLARDIVRNCARYMRNCQYATQIDEGKHDDSDIVSYALAAIKRGRALAAGDR